MMNGGTPHSQRGGGGSETAWELSGSKRVSPAVRPDGAVQHVPDQSSGIVWRTRFPQQVSLHGEQSLRFKDVVGIP